MLAGGLSRRGIPYVYAGGKDKSGASVGGSVGFGGKRVYGSYNKRGKQVRVRHNLSSGRTQLRLRNKRRKIGFSFW